MKNLSAFFHIYYDFLSNAEYEDCNQAVKRIYERINMDDIKAFIDNAPYISELQKEFYKKYIAARVDLILRPAYEMAEEPGSTMSM